MIKKADAKLDNETMKWLVFPYFFLPKEKRLTNLVWGYIPSDVNLNLLKLLFVDRSKIAPPRR